MSERPDPLHSVPTLTEEIAWPEPVRPPGLDPVSEPPAGLQQPPTTASRSTSMPQPPAEPFAAPTTEPQPAAAAPLPSEDELTERILAELQQQIDLVLEYRVREALTPILTRATDTLVREARNELSRSLHDVVSRAVARELTRRRSR